MRRTQCQYPGRRRTRRAGFATVEVALALPVFAVLLLGMIEFTLLFYARSSLVEASRAGARAAARSGGNQPSVRSEVKEVLPLALHDGLEIGIEGGARPGQAVTVALRVPMNSAAPDLLWLIGYSLEDRSLYAEATMIKE